MPPGIHEAGPVEVPAAVPPRTVTPARLRKAALTVALVLGAVVVALPSPVRPGPAPRGGEPAGLGDVWPHARPVELRGNLDGGAPYTPMVVGSGTSVGVSPSADGTQVRLMFLPEGGPPRVVRALPADRSPRFVGVTATAAGLVWAETFETETTGTGEIWRAGPDGTGPAPVTADTGRMVVFGAQGDLVVHDATVSWAASVPGPATEIRSVALAGGAVHRTTLPGRYSLAAWPWAVSAAVEQPGSTDLVDVTTLRSTPVRGEATEILDCGPVWCRVRVLRQDGVARHELMRPDGGDRRRLAAGDLRPALRDVALLDRFEILLGTTDVYVYDTTRRRLVRVAGPVGTVLGHGAALWWSTGDNDRLTWHVLDLGALD
ncbi:hypothetical protein AB0M43_05695 [Longispora sp. NPDC051575]|uniref:hypothetical protein n=1 Tax=Longispora sp. NPDC051575 TaxID=3154943 RepID=UPI003435EA33